MLVQRRGFHTFDFNNTVRYNRLRIAKKHRRVKYSAKKRQQNHCNNADVVYSDDDSDGEKQWSSSFMFSRLLSIDVCT